MVEPGFYSWEISCRVPDFQLFLQNEEDLAVLGTHFPKAVAIQAEKQLPPLHRHTLCMPPQSSALTQRPRGLHPVPSSSASEQRR